MTHRHTVTVPHPADGTADWRRWTSNRTDHKSVIQQTLKIPTAGSGGQDQERIKKILSEQFRGELETHILITTFVKLVIPADNSDARAAGSKEEKKQLNALVMKHGMLKIANAESGYRTMRLWRRPQTSSASTD